MNDIFSYQNIPPVSRVPFDINSEAAIRDLQEMLAEYNKVNSKQTKQMIFLTWIIAILTLFLLVGLIIQISFAIN